MISCEALLHTQRLREVTHRVGALKTSLTSYFDNPNAKDCFANLVDSLSISEVETSLTKDRRSYFLTVCRPALELVSQSGLLDEEELLLSLATHGLHVSESKIETEIFEDAITAIQNYHNLHMTREPPSVAVIAKVGNLFHQAFVYNPAMFDADSAYNCFSQAFKSYPKDINVIEGLSRTLLSRAETFGLFDTSLFQESTQYIESFLGLCHTSRTNTLIDTVNMTSRSRYCRALMNLLCAQRKAFEVRLVTTDICHVIETLRKLLSVVPKDEEWLYKVELSTSLRLRFRHTEALEDGEEALALAIQAHGAAPGTARAQAECLEAYAKVLSVQYEFFETESLLDEIVALFSKALSTRLEDSSPAYLLPMALLDFASAVGFRYSKLGYLKDMEMAVCCAEHVLRCFPSTGDHFDLRRSSCLQALGNIHLRLHWRSSGVEQLDKALHYYKICEEQNEYPSTFSLYGTSQFNYALAQKGYRRDDTVLAKIAIDRKSDWLAAHAGDKFQLSPIDNINHALIPGQAISFVARELPTAKERDEMVEDAILTLKVAMRHRSRAARFVYIYDALAIALHCKAMYSGRLTDYEDSLQHYRKSSELFTEEQMTNHQRIKISFAAVLYMAAEIGNTVPYAHEAIEMLSPIIQDERLSDWVRVQAAVSAAKFHYSLLGDAKAASLALLKAHELIPRATSVMSRSDQLHLLEEEFDIPAWTLVLSLSQSSTKTSLELLERGRNVFWDGVLKKKTVYSSGSSGFVPDGGVYRALRRLSLSSAPSQSSQVRPEDLFQDAQDSSINLEDDGQSGPVVFINIHALRSDALILTTHTILRVELPNLKEADCVSYYHQYVEAQSKLSDEQSKIVASQMIGEVCKWLWETAAREILDLLGIHDRLQTGLASPPRIWWVTTKWISVLPIHAAGDYMTAMDTGEPLTVFDRVVSSYVPTIKVLRLLRQRSRVFESLALEDSATALLVAMPTTPSFPDLPCAREEIEIVKTRVSSFLRVHELIRPTSDAVIEPLKDCTLAHFACHTKIDDRDPSKTQLQLSNWRSAEALTVDKLLDLELPDCQMVYLSACNSARDWVARETSMHVAIGFLMTGVPNVIGTMWKVQDEISAEVATKFYGNLNLAESMKNISSAAVILHETVRELKEGGAQLVDWAPYVHFGS